MKLRTGLILGKSMRLFGEPTAARSSPTVTSIKHLVVLATFFVTVGAGCQQIVGMDGRKSDAVFIQQDSWGIDYIAQDDLDLIHDQTCWAMSGSSYCIPDWQNSRFQFKLQTILTKPDGRGTTTLISLYLADTAHAELIEEVVTGFGANGKVLWHKDHRSYNDMEFRLTESGNREQLKLVLSVCSALEDREPTKVGKDVEYLSRHLSR
jgi:hypothetical protein